MKIVLIIEGKTEKVFLPFLRAYLRQHLEARMPRIVAHCFDGRIPTEAKLRRVVDNHLSGKDAADHVLALTDVYTGTQPPMFADATEAKQKMRTWVGPEPRFHPHAAQHDFEAWLLPYWSVIQKLAGHNQKVPSGTPESINHGKPPAHLINALYEKGASRDSYVKPRDAARILREVDLSLAVEVCPELKGLINTLLRISGGSVLP